MTIQTATATGVTPAPVTAPDAADTKEQVALCIQWLDALAEEGFEDGWEGEPSYPGEVARVDGYAFDANSHTYSDLNMIGVAWEAVGLPLPDKESAVDLYLKPGTFAHVGDAFVFNFVGTRIVAKVSVRAADSDGNCDVDVALLVAESDAAVASLIAAAAEDLNDLTVASLIDEVAAVSRHNKLLQSRDFVDTLLLQLEMA